MKFSQKKTCKNCTIAFENICNVTKIDSDDKGNIPGHMLPKIPTEPCYKPLTNREWSLFIRTLINVQRNEIEILRIKSSNI